MAAGQSFAPTRTVVVELDGVQWPSERSIAETVLGRRPGVQSVVANPVAQTATVIYDPARTTVAELADWIRDCGYHCRGESVPDHLCPLPETMTQPPGPAQHPGGGHTAHQATPAGVPDRMAAPRR